MTQTLTPASELTSSSSRFMSEVYGEVLESYLKADEYERKCLEISGELGGAMRYMASYPSLQRTTFWKGRDLCSLVAKEMVKTGVRLYSLPYRFKNNKGDIRT